MAWPLKLALKLTVIFATVSEAGGEAVIIVIVLALPDLVFVVAALPNVCAVGPAVNCFCAVSAFGSSATARMSPTQSFGAAPLPE